MIIYDSRRCAGLPLIFQLQGSIYPRCLPHILLSTSIVVALKLIRSYTDYTWFDKIFEHPYVYQIFTFVLGFIMVFRSSLAYSRFWEGRTELETMSSKWGDAALLSVVFDNASGDDVVPSKNHWRWQLLSLSSLLHGMALATLGGVEEFEVLSGIDPKCVEAFREQLVNDQVNVAFLWLQDTLTQRHASGGLDIPSPIITRIFQELSTGMLGFNNAVKIHNTPFPFPYVQLISLCLLILTVTSGFVMHHYIDNAFWAVVFTAITVGGYHSINEVAVELEDPFGDDANDLPMEAYQRQFNARLLSMSYIDSEPFKCPAPDFSFEPPARLEDRPAIFDGQQHIRFEDQDIPFAWVSHLTGPAEFTEQSEEAQAKKDSDPELRMRRVTIPSRRQSTSTVVPAPK